MANRANRPYPAASAYPLRMKYAFAIWFPIVATAIIVASLAIVGMPPVQSGPGALTALGLIPNLIVLALCLVVGVLSLVCRPRPLIASPSVAAVAIVGYLAVAITLFASSTINGYDTTQIVVSDSGRQPVSGVTIRVTSHQPVSLIGALTARTDRELVTDSSGRASLRLNRRHTIYGNVNAEASGYLRTYRFASIMRSPNRDGTYRVEHSWSSNKEEHSGTNMHFHISKSEPYSKTLKVFLPSVGGVDTDPYASP